MRKLIFTIACAMFVLMATTTRAQSYSINKLNYDYRMYSPQVGDRYNPGLCGAASFLFPGLGQIVAGETGRGLAFAGAYVGSAVVYSVGAIMLSNQDMQGAGTVIIGIGGMIGVGIWSIVDAVKVAKVNNLYMRDRHRTSLIDIEISRYLSPVSSFSPAQSSAGMSVRLRF